MQPLISVIVPVYGAAAYLEACVDSIRGQTHQNLDIILVDDGSTDGGGELCDALARQDSRIRVFHKPNGGQSSARNLGLAQARGEYAAFVDADDRVCPDMYARLLGHLQHYGAQVAACGICREHADGSVSYFDPDYPADTRVRVYDSPDHLCRLLSNTTLTNSPCDKLFRRELIAHIPMREGIIFEDMEVMPRWLEKAQRVVYDPVPGYRYRLTAESTLRGAYRPGLMISADITRDRAAWYGQHYPQFYPQALAACLKDAMGVVYMARGSKPCAQKRRQLIRFLRQKHPRAALSALRRNDRIKLAVLRVNVPLFCLAVDAYRLVTRQPL